MILQVVECTACEARARRFVVEITFGTECVSVQFELVEARTSVRTSSDGAGNKTEVKTHEKRK